MPTRCLCSIFLTQDKDIDHLNPLELKSGWEDGGLILLLTLRGPLVVLLILQHPYTVLPPQGLCT